MSVDREVERAGREFEQMVRRLRRHDDAALVHALRVLAGRLRAYARLVGDAELRRDLRWLIHETNAVRDIDVAVENGAASVALGSLRRREASRLHAALQHDRRRLKRLRRCVRHLPRLSPKRAHERIARLQLRVEHMPAPRTEAEMHLQRRKLRELQYCLDWLHEDSRSVQTRQKRVARIIDRAVVRRVEAKVCR